MNLSQFLAELAQRGIKLWLEGDTLRFRAPKGVMTSEDRDLLVLHKAKIISLLSQNNTSAKDTARTIVPVSEKQDIPLSFPQEQLWFLSQLDPNNVSYNELFALRFLGVLNIVALEQSLNKIVARHAALRTNFTTVNGQPVQIIAESLILTVPVIDLSNLPASDTENEVQRLGTEQAQKPFNLVSDPLIQGTVLKLTETEHIFLLKTHHIVWDGWSLGIMCQELAAFYNDLSQDLPPLPAEYPDFAVWQRQYLTGEVLDSLQTYWQQQLLDAPPLLELPTDRVRGVTQTFRGKHYRFVISKPLTEALIDLSRRQKVTIFMTLLAAFQTLLYRYTGQTDLCLGSPIANRDRSEFKDLIGYFVNTLVLRTCLAGNPSFEELLYRVRKVMLGAYANRELPFEKLVEILQPERSLSYTPLFQVMLMLLNELPDIEMEGLKVSPLAVETGIAPFDLTLCIENNASGLTGEWEYNTDLFDDATIARMTGHFQTLLEGIVANPQEPISDLPLLTPGERQQLLVEWNNTAKDYPQEKCIHQLFEEQVERTPDAVAVVFEEKQLTYRELNAKANQLANYLRSLGVGPEVLVGICVERSLEMIIGLLGILKAGGAYVPLDPNYPSERLVFMVEDSSVPVLLTQEQLVEKLPAHSARVICLDSDWEEISFHSQENPSSEVRPENLAYVIYTSGSTGKPKGVLIEHRSLVNYTTVAIAEYQIEKSDRILQFSSISFDVSAEEIYTSLASGATLVLRTDTMLDSIDGFLQKCKNWEITVLALPTAYWHELTAFLSQKTLRLSPSLRLVILGGEKALPERLKTWIEYVGLRVHLINNYGPTEATVGATIYDCLVSNPTSTELPIGRPIHNVQAYILDQYQQPVPIGIPGELHIGGAGLARGYLNRPDLTEEKFIPNLFSNQPSDRLYKTGDLARYLSDGNIEYLGRIDNQVKIRGFRIELGEVEAALIQHPAIGETVVVAIENTTNTQQLVAYLVPQTEVSLSISDLRHFLKQQLPDYMIPSAFVTLEHLPLTPNGKLDRRALPAPEIRPELELTFVAPHTPLEEILANIWAEVLGIKQIGINDNFFSLGGHSLLATQIISRIGTNLALEVPLRHLFESPTIASLAEQIQILLSNEKPVQRPPILPVQRTTEIPLSFAQARLWFLDQLQPESGFYNIPNILRLNGQLNISALENSINEIILRHEALRTNFTTQNGKPVQIIQGNLKLKLSIINLEPLSKEAREIEAERLVTGSANQPFNLQQEPLVRSSLLKLREQDYIFVLVFHHIIADGWSIEVLERELSTIYTALCNNQTPVLPELPIQYADFAVWQRNWLTGEVFQTQLNYWQEQLKGIPALLELPTDRPRPAIQTYQGTHQSFQLPVELSEAIISLCKRMGVTPFMLLLAAFQTLLYRLSGQDDIVVGTPVANRHYQETEKLIGFFVNTVALRATNLSLNPSFEELVRQVREVTLGAYAHQDLPFEELVEALQPERSLSYSPVFQVMFGVENEPLSNFSLPALEVSGLIGETNYAKFDLDLSFQNTNDGFIGQWEYNTDLFDGSTIARMTGYLQTLLSEIVANPKTPISELPLLNKTQQHQLLIEWNKTQKNYPQDRCIHQLFEEQVELTPDAVAVVFEQQKITYRELNLRADQLAHYLQILGVKPEVLVGICVERSLEMIIGLLGILKAGGAYVPLDPNYPSERIAYMLDDSQLSVLLTQEKLVASLPKHQAQVICLDSDWEEISTLCELSPITSVTPENLAYVIYTSGSTGKPKGVLIAHRGLCNLAQAQIKLFDVQPDSRVLQFASISFDASIWEIVMALCAGARLCLGTRELLQPGQPLLRLLQEHSITHLTLVPSALAALPREELPALENIIVAGEPCPTSLVAQWSGGRRFFNAYGPTESTVCATVAQCFKGMDVLPIGRPINNTQVYILDRYLQPVPIGVPGELHIASVGLAQGYLNRPDLTQEKFISNPFSNQPSDRLYKTGDLARYLPDGNIEFLGRIDNQVKIRGFRIELGEIEAALSQHPNLLSVAVVLREDIPSQKSLVAYAVTLQEPKPTVGDLRHFLKERLPDYMVPSAFVILESLPLTPNGKIDRRALPAPDNFHNEQEDKFVAPGTPTEAKLAAIWVQVLGLEKVSINDNFFELGGHSLQAVSLVSKLSVEMNLKVSVKLLFEHPTIAKLAKAIEPLFTTEPSVNPKELQTEVEKPMTASLPKITDSSPFFKLEQRSLLSLLAVGKIAPVDSAALGYLPLSLLKETKLTRDEVLQKWFDNLPMWDAVMETKWGRIAGLTLPIFEDELYSDQQTLVERVIEALEMAGRIGAKTVSLTGLIPSGTDYGRAIAKAIEGRNDLPTITTGHATTCSSVVLTIKKILQISNRSLQGEKVAFIGLGSIGINTLRLMLKCLPHPQSIILCDIYSKQESLQNLQRELSDDLGFRGSVQIAISSSSSELPSEIYDATLIIGATNVPDILDIDRLKSGTLIVDDSGPHCFSPEQAIKRFEKHKDILFTEGGALHAPDSIETVIYLPQLMKKNMAEDSWSNEFKPTNPLNIMGCVMSSLLSSRFDNIKPTVGLPNLETCVQHYEGLERLGFQAADLHCEGYVLQIESNQPSV